MDNVQNVAQAMIKTVCFILWTEWQSLLLVAVSRYQFFGWL
jgi:hypothetical protein